MGRIGGSTYISLNFSSRLEAVMVVEAVNGTAGDSGGEKIDHAPIALVFSAESTPFQRVETGRIAGRNQLFCLLVPVADVVVVVEGGTECRS
ncbi:Protein of unknown function [Pyronema omphalodes CBS 100304]|uniref:Uncharacterized protein n=1 Tax=Pyronema omphalodes (strain CBS 100304) TaxID=1076935 RepID=U4LLD0_PYROM|nr:Protein of unknown function [Pyronema omphalodes CBS 100304]